MERELAAIGGRFSLAERTVDHQLYMEGPSLYCAQHRNAWGVLLLATLYRETRRRWHQKFRVRSDGLIQGIVMDNQSISLLEISCAPFLLVLRML